MPPPLPERYHLEVRLGRDGDIEEWLATDAQLDRPVLIRILGPESTQPRRAEFLDSVREAAAVANVHLASTFAAGELDDGAYSVSEWVGGVTLADRVAAADTIPAHEFISNAAGLAEALAALHAEGGLHGAIDPGAIFYTYAHPAKLAAFGRAAAGASAAEDVRSLAESLEFALTGYHSRRVAPSQLVDGISPQVDQALAAARTGQVDAVRFANMLRSIPEVGTRPPAKPRSWAWLLPVGGLLALAAILIVVGSVLDPGPQSPVLFPVTPQPTVGTTLAPPLPSVPDTTLATVDGTSPQLSVNVATGQPVAYDPFGDGAEEVNTASVVGNLVDGDPASGWRTERYFDPLERLKEGVGVYIPVAGQPGEVEIRGMSAGSAYALYWSAAVPSEFTGWERIASGSSIGATISAQLPPRDSGLWLIWLTSLTEQEDGFYTTIAEVRFRA